VIEAGVFEHLLVVTAVDRARILTFDQGPLVL